VVAPVFADTSCVICNGVRCPAPARGMCLNRPLGHKVFGSPCSSGAVAARYRGGLYNQRWAEGCESRVCLWAMPFPLVSRRSRKVLGQEPLTGANEEKINTTAHVHAETNTQEHLKQAEPTASWALSYQQR